MFKNLTVSTLNNQIIRKTELGHYILCTLTESEIKVLKFEPGSTTGFMVTVNDVKTAIRTIEQAIEHIELYEEKINKPNTMFNEIAAYFTP